jgi:hypothetical protein
MALERVVAMIGPSMHIHHPYFTIFWGKTVCSAHVLVTTLPFFMCVIMTRPATMENIAVRGVAGKTLKMTKRKGPNCLSIRKVAKRIV